MKSIKSIRKGFTLIEFAIIAVVIGVLAAGGIAAYKNYLAQAQQTAAADGLNNFRTIHSGLIVTNSSNKTATIPNYASPNPTLSQLTDPSNGKNFKATGSHDGICVGPNYKVLTFTDDAGTVATTAVGDQAARFGNDVVVDATCL